MSGEPDSTLRSGVALRTYHRRHRGKVRFAEEGQRCGQARRFDYSRRLHLSGSLSVAAPLPQRARSQFLRDRSVDPDAGVRVGRHARIRRAIIDRDVLIPRGALIGFTPEEDQRRHTVTEGGIVVVTAEDEPLIGTISEESLRAEADADRGGAAHT